MNCPGPADFGISPYDLMADIRAAIDAVRSDAQGMSRDEVRLRIIGEMRSRGIMLPPPAVDHVCDDIVRGGSAAGRLQRSAARTANAAELAGFVTRLVIAVARRRPLPHWDMWGMRTLEPIMRLRSDVLLEPGAQEVIGIGKEDVVEVWFERPGLASDATLDVPGQQNRPVTAANVSLVVRRGEERVGVLDDESSNAYITAVRDAYDDGVIPVIIATREKFSNGSWGLRIGYPLPPIGPRNWPPT